MNCEKCKSAKATLFYSDDNGRQHALCGNCSEQQNKISRISKNNLNGNEIITKIINAVDIAEDKPTYILAISTDNNQDISCPCCLTSLSDIRSSGEVGCPRCYEVFAEILLPHLASRNDVEVRMPIARKNAIEKKKLLIELKEQMNLAVAEENFELAAILRDKIKKL